MISEADIDALDLVARRVFNAAHAYGATNSNSVGFKKTQDEYFEAHAAYDDALSIIKEKL